MEKIIFSSTPNFSVFNRSVMRGALICLFLMVSTFVHAVNVKFSTNSVTVGNAIAEIRKQTDYSVDYPNNVLDLNRVIAVNKGNNQLTTVVSKIAGTNLNYTINGRHIIITQKDSVFGAPQSEETKHKISGVVMDSKNGEPIVGATIMVKGTHVGTVTDIDGNFSLEAGSNDILLVTYVGYNGSQTKVGNQTNVKISLSEDSEMLNEVVVVGYGTQKKVNLTGSVAVIDGNDLTDRPVANVTQLLQGAAPNVNVTVGNGMPGKGGSINIRGVASISGSDSPLVLIDGVEGSIDDVNPYDIESISVLKDASSAALYGARAAYGVILVTTKNGQDGKTHISYSGLYGFGGLTTNTDWETRGYYHAAIVDTFFSTYQGKNYTNYTDEDYYELWIRRNDKTENPERPWVVEKNNQYYYYGNTDWWNYFFDDRRPTTQHNVTINGGNKKMQWLMSGGLYSQDGIMRSDTDNFNKVNYRVKLKSQITDWLSLSNNTTYYKSSYSYPGPSGMNSLFNAVKNHALSSLTPTNPDGTATYITHMVDGYRVAEGYNSILEYGKHKNIDSHDNLQTSFEAVLTPVKHLTVTANYTYYYQHYANMNRAVAIPYSTEPGVIEYRPDSQDNLYESSQDWWYHGYNIFATYENTWNKKHHFTATGGTNYETKYHKILNLRRDNLLSEDINDFNLAKGEQITINGGKERYALLGFFGRLNYDYQGKYLLELSGRYDGSSRFRRNHRYGFFPSFSAGWRLSEEKFFAPLRETFDNVKIRASYGTLGNQNVGYYDYLQVINSGSEINYSFGDDKKIVGASASAPNSSVLTWEKVITYNAGLDVTLLNNRLTFSADAYIRDTHDMLMAGKDLPAVYGASSPKENAANLRTTGYELQVTWNDSFKLANSPFNYGVRLGFADASTVITKFDNPNQTIGQYYEGFKVGSIWGFKTDGYFKTDEEAQNYHIDQTYLNSMINIEVVDNGLHAGDIKFVDLDGDGVITPSTSAKDLKDYRIIGNSLPRWTFNGNLNANWKGIGASVSFQGVVRQHWAPGSETYGFWGPYSRPYFSFIPKNFMSKVWSEDNPNAYFPRPRGYVAFPGDGGSRELTRCITKYLQNAGYMRVKNITISYDLPKQWLSHIGLESVRVYFSGENLFTISGLDTDYVDPEMAGAGYSVANNAGHRSVNGYPMSKTYSFGLNVSL